MLHHLKKQQSCYIIQQFKLNLFHERLFSPSLHVHWHLVIKITLCTSAVGANLNHRCQLHHWFIYVGLLYLNQMVSSKDQIEVRRNVPKHC